MPFCSNPQGGETFLFLFDFDDTVLVGDSDRTVPSAMNNNDKRIEQLYMSGKPFVFQEEFKKKKWQWTNFVSFLYSNYKAEEIEKVIPKALLYDEQMIDVFAYLQARRHGGLKACVLQKQEKVVQELEVIGESDTVKKYPYVDICMCSDANVFCIETFFRDVLKISLPSFSFSNPFYDLRKRIGDGETAKILNEEEIKNLLPKNSMGQTAYSMIEWLYNPDFNSEAPVRLPNGDVRRGPIDFVEEATKFLRDESGEKRNVVELIREMTRSTVNNCFRCAQVTPNMCKSQVVEDAIVFYAALLAASRSGEEMPRTDISVVYCGDGNNDYCPIANVLRLRDYAFVRKGFALEKLIVAQKIIVTKAIKNITAENDMLYEDVHINSIFHKITNVDKSSFRFAGVSNIGFWSTAGDLYTLVRNLIDHPMNYKKRTELQNNLRQEFGLIEHRRLPPLVLFDENSSDKEFRRIVLDERIDRLLDSLIASLHVREENRRANKIEFAPEPPSERYDLMNHKPVYSSPFDLTRAIKELQELKSTIHLKSSDDKAKLHFEDVMKKHLYYPLLGMCYGRNLGDMPWLQGEIYIHNLIWQIVHGAFCAQQQKTPLVLYSKLFSPNSFIDRPRGPNPALLEPGFDCAAMNPPSWAVLRNFFAVSGDINSIKHVHRRHSYRVRGVQSDAFPPPSWYRTGDAIEGMQQTDDNEVETVHGCFDLYQDEKDEMNRLFFENRIIPMVLHVADFLSKIEALFVEHSAHNGIEKRKNIMDMILSSSRAELKRLLLASTWGNGVDLSMFTRDELTGTAGKGKNADTDSEKLIVNDIDRVVEYLLLHVLRFNVDKRRHLGFERSSANTSVGAVDIIMDNAGVEAAADMLFALVLLSLFDRHQNERARSTGVEPSGTSPLVVRLHVKATSFYVSDTMAKDVHEMINYWYHYNPGPNWEKNLPEGTPFRDKGCSTVISRVHAVAELFDNYFGGNLINRDFQKHGCSGALGDHRIQIYQHPFFVSPYEFSEAPPQVVDRFFFRKLFIPASMISVVNYDYRQSLAPTQLQYSSTSQISPNSDDIVDPAIQSCSPVFLDGVHVPECQSRIVVNRSQVVGYHITTNICTAPAATPTHELNEEEMNAHRPHMLVAEVIVPMTDIVIVKGDLNYRRLFGDRHWTGDMFFKNTLHERSVKGEGEFNASVSMAQALSHYWPFTTLGMGEQEITTHASTPVPLLALRTIKSEVLIGVPTEKMNELDEKSVEKRDNYKWRYDGSHAVAQFACMD